ncbi:uncharacterized protein LOC129587990 [Paramacrobiotus metropolitanus]|uniref:uncharacterized protein LOC129587990 n=1 Tax=Paramacrobiotus metropolitanus TaxID=2943436 RepID=UPI002445DD56|nr:uncharacterized protein LOC129587990 [Paramacrobiotus metropolitanus]
MEHIRIPHYSASAHITAQLHGTASWEQRNTAIPDETPVADIRRRMLLAIAIQTGIIVSVGILIVVLAPIVLPMASVPISLYLIGGVLILTLFVSALSAYRVHAIKSIGGFQAPADPTEALSVVEMQEAKQFPVLYAFRHYNYALLGVLSGSLIGVVSQIVRDLQHGQVANIQWPLLAFGAGFILLATCNTYNFVATEGYAKELQAKRRDFFSFEEIRRRQLKRSSAAGAPVTFNPLPAHLPVSAPEETLQTVLRNK